MYSRRFERRELLGRVVASRQIEEAGCVRACVFSHTLRRFVVRTGDRSRFHVNKGDSNGSD